MTQIRVLIADDHTILQAGLASLLSLESDMEVVGAASDGARCIRLAEQLQPDVILLDVHMPGGGGLEALPVLRVRAPRCHVLMLTMQDDIASVRRAIAAGASGYVLKDAAAGELVAAIRAVHQGGVFLHPEHARQLLPSPAGNAPPPQRTPRPDLLSEREVEVLTLVAQGYRNTEIAESLFLSVKTVETYKARLMDKLDLHNRAALVRYALEVGLLGKERSG